MKAAAIFLIALLAAANVQADPAAPDSTASNVQLRTYLENDNVPQNREVVYHVELSWQGDPKRYHILNAGEPVLTNLKLRGSGSENDFYLDENNKPFSKKTVTYYFLPQTIGMAYIDGVIIEYQDNITGNMERLISHRLGVKIVGPLDEPGESTDIGQAIVILLALLFVLVVLYFISRYFMVRKKQKELQAELPPTLEERYIQRLENDAASSTAGTGAKFNALTKILNSYFKEKFELSGASGFSEVEEKLPADLLGNDLIEKVKSLSVRSELNQFAGEEISESDFHLFYDTVELLLKKMNSGNID